MRKGQHCTPEQIENYRRASNTPEAIERNRRAHMRANLSPETIEKMRQARLGVRRSPETIEKFRRRRHTPEELEKMRQASLGRRHTPETMKMMRSLFSDPEYIKKQAMGLHSKTKPEKHLEQLLQSLYPGEFKYNGRYDCGISIDRMIPDFVNVNGKKQVIDVHGSYWHEGENVNERMARYAKYGYSALIIWDHELKNEKEVIQRIRAFVGTDPHLYFQTQPVAGSQCTSKIT